MSSNLSVILFTPTLGPGGIPRMRLNLIPALKKLGFKVSLMLNRREGPLMSLIPDDLEVISLDAQKSTLAIPRLARELRRRQPDILLASPIRSGLAALGAKRLGLLRGVKTKIVSSIHNPMSEEADLPTTWREPLIPMFSHYMLPRADAIVAVSKGVADDVAETARIDRSLISVVYNPVLNYNFEERLAEGIDHPWFAADKKIPVVIGVGRLAPQKDFPVLIKAFAEVRRQRACRLAFLGDGPDRESLTKLANESGYGEDIVFLGFKQNPLPYMKAASLFAMSSIHEGCPNALVEAIGCGTPVVSTDCRHGPREILNAGQYGPLVPVGDASALAASIMRTLDNPISSAVLRARAADFNADKIAKDYASVFEKALD